MPFHLCNITSTFILTVKILCDYHPWGTFMTPVQYWKWVTASQAVTDRRESSQDGKGGNSKHRKLWDVMHIHDINLHLDCERKWRETIKKTNPIHMQKRMSYMCSLLRAWGAVKSTAVSPDRASKEMKQIAADMEKGKGRKVSTDWQMNP